jgi:hypothetical protein
MRNARFVLTLVGVMVLGTAGGGASQTLAAAVEQADPRAVFLQRVDAYVDLHRRLEVGLPPQVVTADLERLFDPTLALAREIRRVRADAHQGDVFSPAVADYFRVVIAEALRHGGIVDFLAIVEDDNEVRVAPTVHGDYPAGASISFMPPCLLEALPRLPEELEYRFLGRDLVLWDLHAGLIVDFIPRALAEITVPACS